MTTIPDSRRRPASRDDVGLRSPAVLPGDSCASLFEFAPAGYLTMNPDGVVTRANFTAASMLGASRDQIRGRPFSRFVRREDEGRFADLLDRVMRTPDCRCCDLALQRPDGPEFEGSLLCQARISGGSRCRSIRAILVDVSARARFEETLRRENGRLRHLVDASDDGCWEVDVTTGRAHFSPRWASMMGLDVRELPPGVQTWVSRIHPDDGATVREAFTRHVRGETGRVEIEYRMRHEDGHWVWVHGRARIVERDGDGRPTWIAGANTDITPRKEAESAIRAEQERLAASAAIHRQVLMRLPVPALLVRPDGSIAFANEAFGRLLGSRGEEVRTLAAWLGQAVADEALRRWLEGAVGPTSPAGDVDGLPEGPIQVPITSGDGTVRTMLLATAPVGGSRLVLLVDLSPELAHVGRVAFASRAATLGLLAAALPHEVNNPLAAAMADAGLASDACRSARDRLRAAGPADAEAVARALDGALDALDDVQESGFRIAQVVKAFARIARPDATRCRVRPLDVARGAVRWVPPHVSRATSVVVEDAGAPDVLAVPGQLEQVVVSLIAQAARAGPDDRRATLVVRVGGRTDGWARIEVVDPGSALDAVTRARLLDPRYVAGAAEATEGIASCLAVCRAIVEGNGGMLTVESTPGSGMAVRIELPAAPPDA